MKRILTDIPSKMLTWNGVNRLKIFWKINALKRKNNEHINVDAMKFVWGLPSFVGYLHALVDRLVVGVGPGV